MFDQLEAFVKNLEITPNIKFNKFCCNLSNSDSIVKKTDSLIKEIQN